MPVYNNSYKLSLLVMLSVYLCCTVSVSVKNSRYGALARNPSSHTKNRELPRPVSPSPNPLPVEDKEPEMFDPATITWDEFVKWGSHREKDKKTRFVQLKYASILYSG